MNGMIIIDKEFCKSCGYCIEFCSEDLISLSDNLNAKGYYHVEFMDENGCTGCATCALVCPEAAIEVYRE